MPKRRALAAAIVVLVLAVGCGSAPSNPDGSQPEASGAGTSGSSAPGGGELAAAIAPVQPVVAQSGEVSGEIGPDAPLVLEAVGPDGAKFRADFPAGATAFPLTVTMRPLASVGGLAGDVEGVVFEPAGTYLIAPAVLTIDGPVARQANARAFGYQETTEGGAAFPEIAAPAAGPLKVIISHFSGYGATTDSPPKWNIGKITAREASELIALEKFVMANAYSGLKTGLLTEAQSTEIINNAMQGIIDATKRLTASEIERAKTGNPDAATQVELITAMAVILGAARADELTGRPGSPEAIKQVVAILDTYEKAVIKHCETNHDLTVLTLIFSLSQQLQLLGPDSAAGREAGWRGCLSVEVRFRTTITQSEMSGEIRFGAIVPATLLFGDDPPPETPYTVASTLSFGDDVCSIRLAVDDGTFTVTRVHLIPAKPASTPPQTKGLQPVPPLEIVDATVEFSIGNPLMRPEIRGQCSDQESTEPLALERFYGGLHPTETRGGGNYVFTGGYTIPGPGSPVLAKRTIEREFGVGIRQFYYSTTIIEIVHTPK